MRRYHLAFFATALLLSALLHRSSTNDFANAAATSATRFVRVALLPICNPGLSCAPETPAKLGATFFRASHSVASFINDVSFGNTRIVGTTLPWLRAKKRLRSADNLVAERDYLMALARNYISPEDVDIYVFYLKLGASSVETVEIVRDKVEKNGEEKVLAFMVNLPVYQKPLSRKPASAILPSTPWALALLQSLGVHGAANTLNCESQTRLSMCTVLRGKDPYSIFGDMAFSLTPKAAVAHSIFGRASPIQKIEKNGSYQLDVTKRANTALAIHLAVPLVLNEAVQFDRLYIEQARLTRFDKRLRDLQGKDLKDGSKTLLTAHDLGAILYLSSSKNRSSQTLLIDTNPQSSRTALTGRSAVLAEFADSALLPGKSFKLFESPLTLEVTGVTKTSLTIKVAGLSQ